MTEPYQQSNDFSWTEKAFQLVEGDVLHAEVVSHKGVVRSRVWGPCPRCGDDLDDRQTHTAVSNLMGASRGPRSGESVEPGPSDGGRWLPVDVSCGCSCPHPGAPNGVMGCGVAFRVELPVRDSQP